MCESVKIAALLQPASSNSPKIVRINRRNIKKITTVMLNISIDTSADINVHHNPLMFFNVPSQVNSHVTWNIAKLTL